MSEPKFHTKLLCTCLVFFFLFLSGCGAIFDLLLKNRESERDEALCKEQCAGFKEYDHYRHCLQKCQFDQFVERNNRKEYAQKEKREREEKERLQEEQFESNKKLSEKIFKERLK